MSMKQSTISEWAEQNGQPTRDKFFEDYLLSKYSLVRI